MSETWQPPSLVCGECWGQNGTGQTGTRSYELKDENETPKCVLAFPGRFYVFPSAGRQRSNFRALSSDDPCGRTFLCTHCGTTGLSIVPPIRKGNCNLPSFNVAPDSRATVLVRKLSFVVISANPR